MTYIIAEPCIDIKDRSCVDVCPVDCIHEFGRMVAAELLRASNVLSAWATCDASDDFASVWHKALGEIGVTTTRQAVGFGDRVDETAEPLSRLLGSGPVTPHAVQGALGHASRQRAIAIFIDEFDRFRDPDGRVLFADTIKALSDRVVSSTIVLIGVADSVGELIREHRSVERALVQIQMPRMSYGDPTTPNAHPWALMEDEAQPFFRQAVELGVTFWDTANVYQLGTSEEIVGRAITRYSSREEIVLATKVRGKMHDGPGGEGLSRKAILEQLDASLTRLGTDYIDLYQIHRFDADTPVEETMEALHDVVKAGKVRYIGASSMYAWQFAKLQHAADCGGWTRFVSMAA